MLVKDSGALHKAGFYLGNSLRGAVPGELWRSRRRMLFARYHRMKPDQQAQILDRVEYYNRLTQSFALAEDAEAIGDFSARGKSRAYSCDFAALIAHFPPALRVRYQFGDVTQVPRQPCFLKSRPVARAAENAPSILLKLNSVRHYRFVKDRLDFADKKPMAVWRGKSNNAQRIDFARQYRPHPQCDIACVRHKEQGEATYLGEFLSISQQLQYQFVVSVEGIDVATNLKWIMASNSVCMMRRPRFETWFMEGRLRAGVHYIELADDFSDLPEKIAYYASHPEEAMQIAGNANRYVKQFLDPTQEALISLLVMEKYFQLSKQLADEVLYLGARL